MFTTGIGIGAQFDPRVPGDPVLHVGRLDLRRGDREEQPGAGARDRPPKRRALWEQQTRLWYEKVPSIRLGDLHGLRAVQEGQGTQRGTERPRFYNVWLEP